MALPLAAACTLSAGRSCTQQSSSSLRRHGSAAQCLRRCRAARSSAQARFAMPRQQPDERSNAVTAPQRSTWLRPGGAWWKAAKPSNMKDVQSIQELVDELAAAPEQLVVVEFYATWCSGCRALAPKLVELAAAHPDVRFLLVDGDENKALCKAMGVTGLPTVQLFVGSEGLVDQFQQKASQIDALSAAVERWSVPRCAVATVPPLPGFAHVKPRAR